MIQKYDFFEIRKIRDLLLQYPPDMDLKHLFITLDSWLISNAHFVEDIYNSKKEFDSINIKSSWYPIIKKSNAIGSLFNELENICVLDRNSLT